MKALPNYFLLTLAFFLGLLFLILTSGCSGTRLDMRLADGGEIEFTQWRMGDRELYSEHIELPEGVVIASAGRGENHTAQTQQFGRTASSITGMISMAYTQVKQVAAKLAAKQAAEKTAQTAIVQGATTDRAGISAAAATIPSVNVEEHSPALIEAVGSATR